MKNIHLLPTKKPSRLFKFANELHLDTIPKDYYKKYNIYITSNEEITGFENNIWVIKGERIFLWQNTMALVSNNKPKKIILTTDQDLIADGVQAIDNEFLEWFVKNPSCEMAHVVYDRDIITEGLQTLKFGGYRIIIPQEEPKSHIEYTNTNDFTSMIYNPQEEPKQDEYTSQDFINEISWNKSEKETLEEAAKRTYQKGLQDDIDLSFYDGVRLGAKWQSDRMYSEEEVLIILDKFLTSMIKGEKTGLLNQWFEQFKKK
jgi:hypothetical protein